MNTFNIYWYDDGGDTAIPGSIKVMYTDKDGSWKEAVMLSKYEDVIAINQYNKIELEPITTSSVKLVLTVKSGKAANGILRWKVSNEDKTPEVVDKTELSNDITAAESKVESAYTAESWKAFAEALANAKKVVADEKATKADIDAAKAALAEAVNGLVDITGLNAAIKAAGAKVESAYTAESWKAFAEALANAKKVVADEKATKADIDAAEVALAKAINGLKEKPSTDNGKDDKNNDQNSGQNNNPSAGQNNGQNNNQNSNQNNNSNGTDNSTTAAIKAGDTVTVKGVVYKVTNADKKEAAAVKPSKKSAKSITIKNTVKINGVSCKVVSISSKAFMGMKKLTKVTIPKNVKTIGSKAFYKDSKLKSVKISATSPKSIGKNAFKGIAKKAKINVPNKQLKKYKSMLKKAKTASTVKIK
ncbi:MAG: leucine-rich repeat domain-containing protein [Lachnospiraceae bacterium]